MTQAQEHRIDPLGGDFERISSVLQGDENAWFVGGALRDALLGRAVLDIDLAVSGDPRAVARQLHAAFGGDIFSLSDRYGTWRVLPAKIDAQLDVSALRGETIDEDLDKRDFTINALAMPLARRDAVLDLHGGIADLATRTLRVLGEQAYQDDSLRPLRMARFACDLGFSPDEQTLALTRRYADALQTVSVERVFAELKLLIDCDQAVAGVRLLDELGLLSVLIPELIELQGVEQSVYHHLDAWDHTLEVLDRCIELTADPVPTFGEHAEKLEQRLDQPLSEDLTRGQALRWGALLHDVAKGRTRVVTDDGRVGFPGHDKLGAEMVNGILGRLKVSDKLTRYVSALTRHHLRLGFLVHKRPLNDRDVYTYLRKCSPVEVEVSVLSVADRMATRGRKADEAIEAHADLAVELTDRALDWRLNPPKPLLRGNELADALGIERGPRIGQLLAEIAEEQYVGTVADRAAAIDFARSQLAM